MPRKKDALALAKLKYARHAAQSRYRGIEFKFAFDEWNQWWLSHGIDKNVDTKWSGSYRPCMCRLGDMGAYEASNVYFANHTDNVRDASRNNRNNSHGFKTVAKYQWGTELVTLEQLKKLTPLAFGPLRGLFLEKDYEANKAYEFNKLQRRWDALPVGLKETKWFGNGRDFFRTIKEAADSIGLPRNRYAYLMSTGKYPRFTEILIDKQQWFKDQSRFPDPLLPTE